MVEASRNNEEDWEQDEEMDDWGDDGEEDDWGLDDGGDEYMVDDIELLKKKSSNIGGSDQAIFTSQGIN